MRRHIVLLTIMMMLIAGTGHAATSIEGLPEEAPDHYDLQVELSSNDAVRRLISVHPVHHLAVSYEESHNGGLSTVVNTKVTPEEYRAMYRLAYKAIASFAISDQAHLTKDATHFRLSLIVNRREIAVRYFSIGHIREVSPAMHEILEIVNGYMPEGETLKF